MKLLENKIALVTGGSRGIGEAICKRFAEHGAHVAFTYLSSVERAERLEKELQGMGVRAKGYQSNAAVMSDAEELVPAVLEEYGQIDILVNNAGISKDNLLLRMTEEQWNDVIQANLNSAFYLTKNCIKPMMKARSGSIINMSSIVGIHGNAGQSSYAASKAGMIGFTKSVALELGSRNVRCNAIAPGFIETDMTAYLQDGDTQQWFDKIPMQRFGKPEEVADVAVFLASDMSSYMSGQVLPVCGAMTT